MTDKEIVDRLYKVITEPGSHPAWHYRTMIQVRRMWPALDKVLNDVVRSRSDR